MNSYWDKLEKCRYCKNYQHKDRNVNNEFDCSIHPFYCKNYNDTSPRYEEVDDRDARDKELDEYEEIEDESKILYGIGSIIGILLVISYFIAIIYLAVVIIIHWFNNDSLSSMQIFKYMISKHTICFVYIVIWTIIATFIKNK